MSRHIIRTAAAALSAAALGTAVAVAVAPAANAATVVAAETAAPSAVPMFTCGWTPANNSNVPAGFSADGVNIRTGGSTSCAIRGEGYVSQTVVVRCAGPEESDGHFWFYLTDRTTGVTGWVRNDLVGFARPYGILDC